ncbi:MAG: selenium-dependent molybdenum cofactor biosynthesis protein YqeB, partial [Clostridiales bacterium]
DAEEVFEKGNIAIMIDENLDCLSQYQPDVLIEATLAKHNTGISKDMAPFTIALGPGFYAGIDADVVIETMRGHDMGRLLIAGEAVPNTGVPGEVGGKSEERVLRATGDGLFEPCCVIGQMVQLGDLIAYCGGVPMPATLDGYIRGLLFPEMDVVKGMKVGDIDPRCKQEHCFTISDKARALGGAVLTAIMQNQNQNQNTQTCACHSGCC